MKAAPCQLTPNGYVESSIEEATYVKLHFQGPSKILYLPIMLKGKREGTGAWSWNGSIDAPTLKPSIKTEGRDFLGGDPKNIDNWPEFVCHSWVNDGRSQFLDDSTHEFKGQTLDLLDVELNETDQN